MECVWLYLPSLHAARTLRSKAGGRRFAQMLSLLPQMPLGPSKAMDWTRERGKGRRRPKSKCIAIQIKSSILRCQFGAGVIGWDSGLAECSSRSHSVALLRFDHHPNRALTTHDTPTSRRRRSYLRTGGV